MARGTESQVTAIGDLDGYKVAEGDPDVRGWKVRGSDDETIGKVNDLLVDRSQMKVRYLDVAVDRGLLKSDRHVLVPVGHAHIDANDNRIRLEGLSSSKVGDLPEYDHNEPLTRDSENKVRQSFDRSYQPSGSDDNYYEHEHYDANRMSGDRNRSRTGGRTSEEESSVALAEEEMDVDRNRRQTGEVGVGKRTETEHVTQTVPRKREEVTVERRPVQPGTEGHLGDDEEMRIPVSEEELDVNKRTVAKEEVVVRKHDVEDQETVEADLKKERAEVKREGSARQR